ncbi:unnamed protein product, partial [Nesidiocoris tenuis]
MNVNYGQFETGMVFCGVKLQHNNISGYSFSWGYHRGGYWSEYCFKHGYFARYVLS